MKPKISVCVITRNDESYIVNCLKSVKPVAFEVIVLDLASTDKTVKLAKKSACVFHSKPVNDLSSARNLCIKKAKGDWLLFLEPFEVISAETQKNLLTFLAAENTARPVLYYLKTFNMQPKGYSSSVSFKPVLFKNNQGIRFTGSVYEYPVKPEGELNHKKIHSLTLLNFEGHKPQAELQGKAAAELVKVTEQAEKDKAGFYWYYQLGNVYNKLHDFYKAVDNYKKAYKIFQETKQPRTDLFAELLVKLAGTMAFCTGNYKECSTVVKELLSMSPDFPDAFFLRAFCTQQSGDYLQAVSHYETLLEKIKKPAEEINPLGLTSLEAELIPMTLLQMGRCFRLSGNSEKSAEFFENALKYSPESPEINLHLIRHYLLTDKLTKMMDFYFKTSPQSYTEKERLQMKEVAKLSPITLPYRNLQLKFLRSLETLDLWSEAEKEELKEKINDVSRNIL